MIKTRLRPALFLDRDGVINIDKGYVFRRTDFEFIDGIFELVLAANSAGYLVIIVTNQSGIGRGYYTETDFQALTVWMLNKFQVRGLLIADVYFCPYHPVHGKGKYKIESYERKPAPGMIIKAANAHSIDLEKSIMVGDKLSDMIAGKNANIGRLLHIGDIDSKISIPIRCLHDVIKYL